MLIRSTLALSLAASAVVAQVDPDGMTQRLPRVATQQFLDAAGPNWQLRWSDDRSAPRHIWGGSLQLDVDGTDASFEQQARIVVDSLGEALGFDSSTLTLDRVKNIDLSRIGSSDKVVVKFVQQVDGVRVHQGHVNVLMSADGELLSVDNQGLPDVDRVDTTPSLAQEDAIGAAAAHFFEVTGQPVLSVAFDDYVIYPAAEFAGKRQVAAKAAYVFHVHAPDPRNGELPVARAVVVDAHTGQALDSWSLVHQLDVSGNVRGLGQPGLLPDGQDGEVEIPLQDVRITSSGNPTVYTDVNGDFNIPGASGSTQVTATFNGLFSDVDDNGGSDISVTTTASPSSPASILMNPGASENEVAEVNIHHHVNVMRDWVKSVDPTETMFDFQVDSNANIGSSCNAFYNGISINFYTSGSGCVNTGYSSVVYHEEGHWANDLYGSFNGSDGFGEGGADVWAMFIADDPIVGNGFFGPGTEIRTGLNTSQFCGDANPGCFGQVHADGQVLMGAFWKWRRNVKQSLGAAQGIATADLLMLSWYQVFNQTQIKSVIEEQILVLDDDDGNINNGTPNYAEIDAGFREQGFPGFDLPLFDFDHTPIGVVGSEGPVSLDVTVSEQQGSFGTVELLYSTNGGASFFPVAMTPQGGGTFSADVPGVVSPASVKYYFRANDGGGSGSNTFPAGAPDATFAYDVGVLTVRESNGFEGATDEGWTHVELAQQDDWQRGTPIGASGDAPSAFSGSNVWGNDLAPSGFNGAYQNNVYNQLISPSFDFSGEENLRLRFQRWLTVESGQFDQARILVDGNLVFENAPLVDTIDTAWTAQDIDISAFADDDSDVTITFELITDGGVVFGGWNIDEFEVVSLDPVGSTFIDYGVGTPGFSGLVPELTGAGSTVIGSPVQVDLGAALPFSNGALFLGSSQASLSGLGGTFLVGNVLTSLPFATGLGTASFGANLPNDPSLIGTQVNLQAWIVDPAGPQGYSASNGLQFTVQ